MLDLNQFKYALEIGCCVHIIELASKIPSKYDVVTRELT